MQIHQLQSKTKRQSRKYKGRGGKKGAYSGKGMKGQKSRAGSSVKPGFRGGDNRIWQLFPKQRGASKKPGGSGNEGPHRRHRYFMLRQSKPLVLNLDLFNQFKEGDTVTPVTLEENGIIDGVPKKGIKILGGGKISKKLTLEGFNISKSAREKILSAGGTIK